MSRERDLLERFFFSAEPLSITLFGPEYSRPLGFGRARTEVRPRSDFPSGFAQSHRELAGICVFSAKLGRWGCLVAEFPFQELGPGLERAWLRFVHLATVLELAVDLGPSPDSPPADAPVPRPQRPSSWLRIAHAKPESESSDEPA
jgi:hypothetical protein